MAAPLASIYDISLGLHQLTGVALLVLAVFIAVLTILARNEEQVLDKALVFKRLAGPLIGVVAVTGAYQLIDANIKLFQAWVIGAILLGVGFMGTLDGTWVPMARRIRSGEVEGDALEKLKLSAIGVAVSMIVMLIGATWLMESKPG